MMKYLNKLKFNVICKKMAFAALCASALLTPTPSFGGDLSDEENYIIEGIGSKNFVITKDATFDGQKISIAAENCTKKYNHILYTKNGLFELDTDYILEFTVKVDSPCKEGAFYAFIRSDKFPKEKDILSCTVPSTRGCKTTRRIHHQQLQYFHLDHYSLLDYYNSKHIDSIRLKHFLYQDTVHHPHSGIYRQTDHNIYSGGSRTRFHGRRCSHGRLTGC